MTGSPWVEDKVLFLILIASPFLEHYREGHGFSRAKKEALQRGGAVVTEVDCNAVKCE
jgi:hypothetical protein